MYKLILIEIASTNFPSVMNGETMERRIRQLFMTKDSLEYMFRLDESMKPCPTIFHLNDQADANLDTARSGLIANPMH